MRRTIIKILNVLCIGIGLLAINQIANASYFKSENNVKVNKITNEISIKSKPLIVYADTSQWNYISPFWELATPDFQQTYYNAWASVNGDWYYINSDGHLVEKCMIKDVINNKEYYVKEDGSLLISDYYTDYSDNQTKYYASNDGTLTVVNN
jgi:glucan-binding YG repeat protein